MQGNLPADAPTSWQTHQLLPLLSQALSQQDSPLLPASDARAVLDCMEMCLQTEQPVTSERGAAACALDLEELSMLVDVGSVMATLLECAHPHLPVQLPQLHALVQRASDAAAAAVSGEEGGGQQQKGGEAQEGAAENAVTEEVGKGVQQTGGGSRAHESGQQQQQPSDPSALSGAIEAHLVSLLAGRAL